MINKPSIFDVFDSLTSHVKPIQVADRTPMSILRARTVSLSPTFSMNSISLASTLKNTLSLISQLTKNIISSITFYSTYCVLQNNQTKMISIGRERRSLYYLEKSYGNPSCGF